MSASIRYRKFPNCRTGTIVGAGSADIVVVKRNAPPRSGAGKKAHDDTSEKKIFVPRGERFAKITNTRRKPKRPRVAAETGPGRFSNWLGDHELPPSGALFALQTTRNHRHHGIKRGPHANISAAGIGMSKGTVVNLLHLFERRGHLKVQ